MQTTARKLKTIVYFGGKINKFVSSVRYPVFECWNLTDALPELHPSVNEDPEFLLTVIISQKV